MGGGKTPGDFPDILAGASRPPSPSPAQYDASPAAVVLVHGLWMTGLEMALLRRRLRRCGFLPCQFSYPTVRAPVVENAARLHGFLRRVSAPVVHFVGHSLGGLVIRRLFHDHPPRRPGRIVTLGTPHRGSAVARRLARHGWGRRLLGGSFKGGLSGELPPWTGTRELGVIAGDRSLGVGLLFSRLVPALARPNDGTVAVEETRMAGAADHVVLHASHMGLLVSAAAARQTCAFLRTGRFLPSPAECAPSQRKFTQ